MRYRVFVLHACCFLHWGLRPSFASSDPQWWQFGTDQESGLNQPAYPLTTFNGHLVAGGAFTYPGGDSGDGLVAQWDGTRWQRLGKGLGWDVNQGGYFPAVTELTTYNGELIAAGRF